MDRYSDWTWTPAPDDHAPWVQFDMEQEVTAWGVVVKFRRDEQYTNQIATSLKVATSVDRLKWNDVSRVLPTNHTTYPSSVTWLEKAAAAQYWRIHVRGWYKQPSIKAELVGQPKGNVGLDTLIGQYQLFHSRHNALGFRSALTFKDIPVK